MEIANIILEYLKVIFNWPVTGAVVLILFLLRHQSTIDKILQSVKKAGPVEFQGEQSESAKVTIVNPEVTEPNYEFIFLSQSALALTTKNELFKLALLGPKTIDQFKNDIVLPEAVQDKTIEREAIFMALLRSHLVDVEKDLLKVTPKGKEFLKFLGYQIPK